MTKYVGAIDQGTTSSRFIIFDRKGTIMGVAQEEFEQIFPKPGWVEHDPMAIMRTVENTVKGALRNAKIETKDLAAVGVTNQRETTVIWDKYTGTPYYNAIVWQDVRTDYICKELEKDGGQGRWIQKTGLPVSTYFSSTKVRWILDNVPGLQEKAERGDALFGNIDTWVIWNLTGGPNGGLHITDVSNGSRTQLMNIHTCEWDDDILKALNIPKAMLPKIMPSSKVYGTCQGVLEGVPVAGDLGDQQAAVFGQTCYTKGDGKCTYGTALCLLYNTGTTPIYSSAGLLTTVGYKIGDEGEVHYILEGTNATAGAVVQWLRDNLGILTKSSDVETLASSVDDNGGAYFVPAFSGLFAPYWKTDARGVIAGLTRYVTKGHIARAALESLCYQTKEMLDAMSEDWGVKFQTLKVDGGGVYNELLMQFLADMLDLEVIRPVVTETTALGAAYAAGLAVGYWESVEDLCANWAVDKTWKPQMDAETRGKLYKGWLKAIERSMGWID
jgi:glycerol kinase